MLTLTVTPQGAEVIIAALRQLPHAQVHDLVMELFGQVQKQQQEAAASAPAEEVEVKAEGTE
jgi:hypothetical protein